MATESAEYATSDQKTAGFFFCVCFCASAQAFRLHPIVQPVSPFVCLYLAEAQR